MTGHPIAENNDFHDRRCSSQLLRRTTSRRGKMGTFVIKLAEI